MYRLFAIIIIYLIFNNYSNAQGCVAIRGTGGVCTMDHPKEGDARQHLWSLDVSDRYFRSFRHYVGETEQKQRLANHDEVINHVNTLDLSLVHYFNNRLSASFGVPVIANSRSQLSKFGNKDRFSTHSFGLVILE